MFKLRSTVTILTVAVALMLATLLSACGDDKGNLGNSNSANPLIGRWQQTSTGGVAGFNSEKGTIIEFFPNGQADLKKYASPYTLLGSNKMTLSLGAFTSTYSYEVQDNHLTITRLSDNVAYQYDKAK